MAHNENIDKPLPYKELEFHGHEWNRNVMFFDPRPVLERVKIDHSKRHPSVRIGDIFPANGSICSCGCNRPLSGRRKRWYSSDCSKFANAVWAIFSGRLEFVRNRIAKYYGWKCAHCGEETTDLHCDHILPVKHGGGGWWLGNYQLLCHKCHKIKTNQDFNYKSK